LIVTLALGFAIEKTIGFRINSDDEVEGIDFTEHSETAYDFVARSGGLPDTTKPSATVQADAEARGVNA
jgi:ammonium transporter, Amt family